MECAWSQPNRLGVAPVALRMQVTQAYPIPFCPLASLHTPAGHPSHPTPWMAGSRVAGYADASSSCIFLSTLSRASACTSSMVLLTSTLMTSRSSAVGGSRMLNWLCTMLAPM